VLKSFRNIDEGVRKLLQPDRFAEFRANAKAYKNNALYEIPEFLEEIAERRASAGRGSPITAAEGTPALQRAAWASITSRLQLDWGT